MNSLASTATFQPRRAAASEVTGLKLARRTSRPTRWRAGSGKRPCNRVVMAELVSVIQSTRAVQDPFHDGVGQGLGVGVVVDGYLVDVGQLLAQLVLEDGSSAIGAGEQDPAALRTPAEDLGERLGAVGVWHQIRAEVECGQGLRRRRTDRRELQMCPGPAGHGLVARAAEGRTARRWPT